MNERDPLLEAVLATGVKLPTPNAALLRVQMLAADEDAGPNELAQAIGQDPALTGEFIRVANSPVFRTRTPARSVKAAITILGRTRTLAVIASSALRSQMADVPPRAVEFIWSRSAIAADHAYRAAQVSLVRGIADLAFLAALMHDIGIAVVLRRFPEHAGLFDPSAGSLDAAALRLDRETGADHAVVGGMVARNWKLPAEVADAMILHHQPAAVRQAPPLVAALATLIAVARRLRDGASEEWDCWEALAEAHLDITPAKVEALLAEPDED